ncbi:MAG: hypothetical protein ACI9G1_005115 [Pirellulaceae bacterium]|jgi:hypothetical protein
MSFRLQTSFLIVALSACTITSTAPTAWCNELVTEEKASINKWIKELDSDLFSERNAASRELDRLGSRAFPALEEAAMNSESREVTSRSVDVLKGWFGREDTPEHKTAEESLKRISAGEHGPAARLAKNVLSPPVIESPLQNRFGGGQVIINGNAQIRIAGGGIQFQRKAFPVIPGGKFKRMSTKIVNGRKEIEVEEGEQKVKIVEEKEGKITVEITKKVDGKEKTDKFEAKDAAELKKNHPDASKEYEKYAGKVRGNNIAQIQIQNIVPQILPNGPQQVPGRKIRPAAPPAVLPQNLRDRLKGHQKTIEKRIADLDPNKEADKQNIESLKKQIEGLQKIIDR